MLKHDSPRAGVLEVKKQLASAVAANRSEDIKRLLLRLRQELVVSEELLRVSVVSVLLASYRLDVAHTKGCSQETKIGLTVGKLRSNPSKQIADLAKDIVQKVCVCSCSFEACRRLRKDLVDRSPSTLFIVLSGRRMSVPCARQPRLSPNQKNPSAVSSLSLCHFHAASCQMSYCCLR